MSTLPGTGHTHTPLQREYLGCFQLPAMKLTLMIDNLIGYSLQRRHCRMSETDLCRVHDFGKQHNVIQGPFISRAVLSACILLDCCKESLLGTPEFWKGQIMSNLKEGMCKRSQTHLRVEETTEPECLWASVQQPISKLIVARNQSAKPRAETSSVPGDCKPIAWHIGMPDGLNALQKLWRCCNRTCDVADGQYTCSCTITCHHNRIVLPSYLQVPVSTRQEKP